MAVDVLTSRSRRHFQAEEHTYRHSVRTCSPNCSIAAATRSGSRTLINIGDRINTRVREFRDSPARGSAHDIKAKLAEIIARSEHESDNARRER